METQLTDTEMVKTKDHRFYSYDYNSIHERDNIIYSNNYEKYDDYWFVKCSDEITDKT